jgi:hypothetical protein
MKVFLLNASIFLNVPREPKQSSEALAGRDTKPLASHDCVVAYHAEASTWRSEPLAVVTVDKRP